MEESDCVVKIVPLFGQKSTKRSRRKYTKAFDVSAIRASLPVIEVEEIEPLKTKKGHFSSQLISAIIPKPEEDHNKLEYDYDEQDSMFLKDLNILRKKQKETSIAVNVFERVIDRLEKECSLELCSSVVPGTSATEDDLCCICGDGDVTNSNQIIYCDMCNVAVHQECYGVPYIPEGQWLCRRCDRSPTKLVQCVLCPNPGGAFKQTNDGAWAHVICAIWLNEVHFLNAVFLEPIVGVPKALELRRKLTCMICRKKVGACLQCSARSCLKAFHITCAQQAGMAMYWKSIADPSAPDGVDVQRFVYCHLHDDEAEYGDAASRKKRMKAAVRNARRSMMAVHEITPQFQMPTITQMALDRIRDLVGIDIDPLVEYWYLKRKSRCGVPLIKRFMISTQKRVSMSEAEETFTKDEKGLANRFRTKRTLFENWRMLAELSNKREKLKNKHFSYTISGLVKIIAVENQLMESLITRIAEEDVDQVFASPVTIDGYSAIIKHPIDLSTMRERLSNGIYETIEDIKNDFILMMENCQKFNRDNPWYLKYGKNLKSVCLPIINDAAKRIKESPGNIPTSLEKELKDFSSLMFYDGIRPSTPSEEETDLESESEIMRRSTRRNNTTVAIKESMTPSFPPKARTFLSSPFSTPSTRNVKRKGESSYLSSASNKKSKKDGDFPFRQTTITRFCIPNATSNPLLERQTRSSPLIPLMDFRDNSVKSPLVCDSVSSESSADEEDVRPSRRHAILPYPQNDHQKDNDNGGFYHNAIVNVDGTAGRVLLPSQVYLEEGMPQALLNECRRRKSRDDQQVLVMLFGTENKWNWFNISSVRSLNLNGHVTGVGKQSLELARKWIKNLLDGK